MSDPSRQAETGGTLTGDEAARLTDQLADLTRSGLPLAPGLAALGNELPAGRLRASLEGLAAAIDRGLPLDEAVERQRDRIPPHLRGLVAGGLKTGRLGDILGRFSAYMSVGTELKRKLWLSMAYPTLAITAAVALWLFVHVVLVGLFDPIYRDFGVPLPRMTVGMIWLSRGLQTGWPVALILLGSLVGAWILARLTLPSAQRRSIATRIPVLGKVWRYISWAEFSHLLALLLESRLTLPEALRTTGEGVQDADIDRACRRMAEHVEGGGSLAGALLARPELPSGLARLLHWAGGPEASAEILHMAGEMFEARARSQAAFAGTVMAVLAAILVLWGTFSIVGLILPLVTLISKLSG